MSAHPQPCSFTPTTAPIPYLVYISPTPAFEHLAQRSRNAARTSLVRSLLHSTGLSSQCRVLLPRLATLDEAALAHSRRYLRLLARQSHRASRDDSDDIADDDDDDDDEDEGIADGRDRREVLEEAGLVDDCAVWPGVWELAMMTVGGSVVAAAELVRGSASVACWFEGGRHHAAVESAHGFCYLNDMVVAIKVLLASPTVHHILYLDIDIHHGDGVENAFLYTNMVTTLSLHLCEPGFYPNTGRSTFATHGATKTSAIRVPLRHGIDDAMYATVFTAAVDAVLTRCAPPDAIVLQCGVDGVCGDPLGSFNLTAAAYTACVEKILSLHRPTLILGGGGYHPANASRVWADVLECCIRTLRRARPRMTSPPVASRGTRDVPLADEFFTHYGPSFSRDIKPQAMNNENTVEELDALVAAIAAEPVAQVA